MLVSCQSHQSEVKLKQLVTKHYGKTTKGVIAINLDKCSSCFADLHEKIQIELQTNPEHHILILSENRKNAHIFMKEHKIDFSWDSLKLSKPFLLDKSYYVEN